MKELKDKSLVTIAAVDSNVFFMLASSNETYLPKKKDKNGFYNTIRSLKRKCMNGSLKIAILPQVWKEIEANMDNREREFLKNYCFFIEPKNIEEYATKVAKLAHDYIKSGVMEDEDKNLSITADAIIMAQSSIAGLNLITSNQKHFLYYDHGIKKNKKEVIRNRADDIEKINSRHGLYFEMNNGVSFVPRPCSPAEYFELFKGGPFYEQENYEDIDLVQKDL